MNQSEPILLNGAAVSGAVVAVIALLSAFGVEITDAQNQAIVGVVSAVVIPLGTWLLARRQTVPVAKANEAVSQAVGKKVEPFKVGQ